MYNQHDNALGQAPQESPSLWDSFSNLVTSGVGAGFNIYNRITGLQQQKKQTAATQAQAAQIARSYDYAVTQPISGVQPGMLRAQYPQQTGMFGGMGDWTVPLLVGGIAIVGLVALRPTMRRR